MLNKNIMLIGGGNMGSALVKGILKANLAPPERITVVDVHTGKLGELSSECGVRVDTQPGPHMAAAEVIILAIKPQVLNEVIDSLRDSIRSEQLVISILAGVETTYIRDRLGKKNPVIRVMPNIAATVDAAASALAGCDPVTDEDYQVAEAIFGAVGTVARVEENLLDAVTGAQRQRTCLHLHGHRGPLRWWSEDGFATQCSDDTSDADGIGSRQTGPRNRRASGRPARSGHDARGNDDFGSARAGRARTARHAHQRRSNGYEALGRAEPDGTRKRLKTRIPP